MEICSTDTFFALHSLPYAPHRLFRIFPAETATKITLPMGSQGKHISEKPRDSDPWAAEALTPVGSGGSFPSPYAGLAKSCPRRE